MFGGSSGFGRGGCGENKPCYKVELFSKGASVKFWTIKDEYYFGDDLFTAETTAGKSLNIALGEHDTLVIEET